MKVKAEVRLRAYSIISDAVEDAVMSGWRRATKHTEPDAVPPDEIVHEAMHDAVMLALTEVIDFGED